MVSSERIRSRAERDIDEDVEVNIDAVRDDDDDKYGYDKSKNRSSKSRKLEEADGLDGSSGRKRTSSDRHDSRKRVSSSGKAAADQDDYEARKESRKHVKKKSEENMLDKLGTWYQDGEAEKKFDSSERSVKHSVNVDKETDRDSRYSERRDGGRERGHGLSEHGRSSRKRWDESGNAGKADGNVEKSDTRLGNPSDTKLESAREVGTVEIQSNENKIRGSESIENKSTKSLDGEERKVDSERSKRVRTEVPEEDNTRSFDDKSTKERILTQDIAVNSDRSLNADEDVGMSSRDRNRRDMEISKSSRTPEKTGKRPFESDEMDYERSSSFRRKEQGKDVSFDDRSKGRDDSWSDRNRDRDNSKESWKRRQDKTTRDGESNYDNNKDWAPHRRPDWEHQSRFSGRKDGNRTEAVKTSSKYGISNENYDVIEIQTKPFDHGRDDSRPVFVKNETTPQSDTKPTPEVDEFASMQDQRPWKEDNDVQMEKYKGPKSDEANRGLGTQSSTSGPLPPYGNRMGRGGRGRFAGRDGPMPNVGSPFGPIGLPPPRPMPSLPANMSPAPGPISPGVFLQPFPPIMWPGARGLDMNMLAIPPGLPAGPMGPRFPPNMGNPQNGSVFSPSGAGGMISSISSPNFNAMVRGQSQDKWIPNRTNAPPGKAPSRGEQNDYSQNFVDTGTRPQNYIRELEPTSVVEDYPKLRELIQRKDEIVAKSSSPPMYHKCDLREQVLSPEFFGTKFDVILVDPPWEEYVHRAPGVTDHMDHWTFEEIMNLKIEAIADTPSFIFLWVGDGVGLEQGRQCLKKWGFRRCEDICWVKTNKTNATPGLRHDSHTLYQRTKEHCLMGIKGTVRRSTDGHIIHANIDTDVIIAEEPPYGSTAKPEDMYRIIEHFALGRRRLELFGGDHNIRSGWLTLGNGLTSSNFNSQVYIRNFADKDGKVWVGGAGRNPPPEAPHLALTTPEIESLRPKSPMKNQQQLAQQQPPSLAISLTQPTSGNKRPTGNSPGPMNQDASSSSIPSPAPWAASPMVREGDMYGFNGPFGPGPGGDFFDFESHRRMNMM